MRTCRRGNTEVLDEAADNGFAEPAALMVGVDGDVDDLEGEATIADDAAHADELATCANDYGEEGVGQTDGGAFGTLWAQACAHTEVPVLVSGGRVEAKIVLPV